MKMLKLMPFAHYYYCFSLQQYFRSDVHDDDDDDDDDCSAMARLQLTFDFVFQFEHFIQLLNGEIE